MHPFSNPWKCQKTVRFFDVFRGQRKGALGKNGLILHFEANERNTSLEHRRIMLVWLGILCCRGALEERIKTDIFYTSIKRKDFRANSATAGKYGIRVRDRLQISLLILCEFKRLVNFYSPENHPKTIGFFMISGG